MSGTLAVPRGVRWTLSILAVLVLGMPAGAQAAGAADGAAGTARVGRLIREQDRAGWRAALGPHLTRRLAEPLPADGLRVSVVLARDGLPRHRGSARRSAVARRQGRVLDALPRGRFTLRRRFRSLSGFSAQVDADTLDALMRHPETALVYLDGQVQATLSQGSALIGAPAVHASGYTGAGVKVAILDTGIDSNHADLVDDIAAQHCFCRGGCCPGSVNESTSAEDDEGHGTSVSGIITSAAVEAPLGVAPDAEIIAIKVLDSASLGSFSDIAAALDWILTESTVPGGPVEGVRVVNLSLSDGIAYNDPSVAPCSGSNTANAIQLLDAAGIAVIVSSGNDGHDDGIAFPACVAEAISVGGVYDAAMSDVSWSTLCTDTGITADTFVCHTNSAEILDVLAPDWRTATSRIGGGSIDFGGTSASASFIAAGAALLFEANPALTPAELRTLLKAYGPLVTNPESGLSFRRTDIDAALMAATTPVCGNAFLESGETCDDGNTADGDCCSATCQLEPDGTVCDDGLTCIGGETCSAGVCEGTDLCSGELICSAAAGGCVGPPPVFEEFTQSSQSTNQVSLTLNTPPGTGEDDLLVAAVTLDGAHSGSLTPPGGEGWTQAALNSGPNTPTLGVWWKLAGASESATHQFTWLGGELALGYLVRFTGHDLASPIEAITVQGGISLFPTAPAITTTSASTLILHIGGFDDDDVVVGNAKMAGYTTIAMDESSVGSDTCSSGAAYRIAGPGTIPSASFTLSSSEQWRTVALAIVPPPAVAEVCGDGVIEGLEACDDGLLNGTTPCGCAFDCRYPLSGTVCNDGVGCTQNEICNGSGVCQTGTPNDALCDNLLFCDGTETCDAVSDCQPGTPPPIDDGVACTEDRCDEGLGQVVHMPDALQCDDGDACTADSCSEIVGCQHALIPQCIATAVPTTSTPVRLMIILALMLAAAGTLPNTRSHERPIRR